MLIIFYSSLVEDMIDGTVIPADFVVTYTVEEEVSQRGKKKLLSSDGYSYTVKVIAFSLDHFNIF